MSVEREFRSYLQVRWDAVRRQILWNFFSGSTPYYLVSEYPRSGGSWVSQMLSAYLGIPYLRNQSASLFHRKPAVLHGHHKYKARFKNAVYVIRDGRDVMVSAYYHWLRLNDRAAEWERRYKIGLQKKLGIDNVENIAEYLPRFIEYMFKVYSRRVFHFSWASFTESAVEHEANIAKYEDLLADGPGTFAKVLGRLTGSGPDMERVAAICEEYSFENQSKRKAGQEDVTSFMRKGIAGDWKNRFSRQARSVFDRYAGDTLIRAGYEADHAWADG